MSFRKCCYIITLCLCTMLCAVNLTAEAASTKTYLPDIQTRKETMTSTEIGSKSSYALSKPDHAADDHKICYGTSCNDSSHRNITWTGWDGTDDISYDADDTACLCLMNDVTKTLTVPEGCTLYLCLNGKTWTGNIMVNGTLHLSDCDGSGAIKNSSGSVIVVKKDGILNYYGGTLTGGSGETSVPLYAEGIVNLYAMPKITTGCDYGIRGNSPGFLHICARLSRSSAPLRVNFGTDPSVSLTTYTQVTLTSGWSVYMNGNDPTDYFAPRLNRYAKIEKDGNELILRRIRITLVAVTTDVFYAKYNGATLATLPSTPIRKGYQFLGWYTAKSGGTMVTVNSSAKFEDDITLYAQWQQIAEIRVEITWGAMAFTYSDGGWNPETHVYETGGWQPDNTDGDRITVENPGGCDVEVTFLYTSLNSAISGGFTDDTGGTVTGPVALPADGKINLRLILDGKPDRNLDNTVIGKITIKLGGN